MTLITDTDMSLLGWMFQHYNAVDIRMSRDVQDGVGHEQWTASTFDTTRTWCTGGGKTLSDAIKNLISRINKVENKKTLWTQS